MSFADMHFLYALAQMEKLGGSIQTEHFDRLFPIFA
jgi:hypothetical protein